LWEMTRRHLIIAFNPEALNVLRNKREIGTRSYWEKLAIAAGFRLHPRTMLVNTYNAREDELIGPHLFLERVPNAALNHFPLTWLGANRDLHMDMLRESGRRSDGHISRYVWAASKVRPGDVVLDAACGLGYGTAVMAACSNGKQFIGVDIDETSTAYGLANFSASDKSISYHASDVTRMAFLPDNSIDLLVSFETIEHVQDYEAFLLEAKRVLKPDGRFIGSVPNLWCDETGKDPNPYHFHVFDWSKLQTAIGNHFIVEERIAQTAGGGYKLWDRKRSLLPVPLAAGNNVEAEWWLISACVNPLEKTSVPYANPFYREQSAAIPMYVDFAKYYDNPWIYRTIVQLGERLADRDTLMHFCQQVANQGNKGSADTGAALCVIAYQLLEYGMVNTANLSQIVAAINLYETSYDKNNPHAHRWLVSLHYVGARLLLLYGNRNEALAAFKACAALDPFIFSPLLATKTVSAHLFAGMILASDEATSEAKQQFELGIQCAQKAMHGNWDHITGKTQDPLSFGFQELAEVAELGGQCVQALRALDKQGSSPGYFLERLNLRRFGIIEWVKSIERENERLRQQLYNAMPSAIKTAV
jgi:ubiquinone/menaquinone biosynthesis C-methylase UbiE